MCRCRSPDSTSTTAGNQRLQFRQAISRGQHDDDRDRQRIGVLLMLDAAVDGDNRIEALAGGKRQQAAVPGAGPAHLLDRVKRERCGE